MLLALQLPLPAGQRWEGRGAPAHCPCLPSLPACAFACACTHVRLHRYAHACVCTRARCTVGWGGVGWGRLQGVLSSLWQDDGSDGRLVGNRLCTFLCAPSLWPACLPPGCSYGVAYWHKRFPHWPLKIRKCESRKLWLEVGRAGRTGGLDLPSTATTHTRATLPAAACTRVLLFFNPLQTDERGGASGGRPSPMFGCWVTRKSEQAEGESMVDCKPGHIRIQQHLGCSGGGGG